MSVRYPKTRLVSFRLSELEYRDLLNLCETNEASSLSDLVRKTVQRIARDGDPSSPGFPGTTRAERLLRPGTEDEGLPSGSVDGWGVTLAREVLKLSRKTDVLDREIRRLSLLVRKR